MNKKIAKDLASLGIYKVKGVSKSTYDAGIHNADENFIFYEDSEYDDFETDRYKMINTMGYTTEEIKLMVEINKAKNIRSIKRMVQFFVVLTVLGIIFAVFSVYGLF